jgi:LuxR family transcriptional regulator, maltose regulon positive regulatory protein
VTFESASDEGRRAQFPQAPLPREVARLRVVRELETRFNRPLTTVVAGAGFGKTTALAQALRGNLAAPRGVDAWVSCEASDGDDRRLARAIVSALGAGAPVDEPLGSVVEALRRMAPVDVCLVLDDLHEIPDESAGQRLVEGVLAALPPHGHLLLASRVTLPFALARRRAAGEVVDLDTADLAFRPEEVAALARLHDGADQEMPDLGGWPSLVALTLSARRSATSDYLWEEIVASLSPDDRRVLLAMITLGWGTARDVAAVADAEVDDAQFTRLVRSVPLVAADSEQRSFSVHQLWENATSRIFDAEDIAGARARTLALFAERDEALRLGSAAIQWDDPDGLRLAGLTLVRVSLGALPIDTARRWLAAAPPDVRQQPELRLLSLALRQAEQVASADIDAEVDELIETFERLPEAGGGAEAMALAAIAAHGRGDLGRLLALGERARALPKSGQLPMLRFLRGAIDASLASLNGDAAQALRIIDTLPFGQVPAPVSEVVTRLRVTMLMLSGRADDAVAVAERLANSADAHVRDRPAHVRWQSGEPWEFAVRPPTLDDSASVNDRDRFTCAAEVAAVSGSLGDRVAAQAAIEQVMCYDGRSSDARHSAITACAIASTRVLEHDEAGARDALEAHLAAHSIDDRLGTLHLRRHLAVGYVLMPELRHHWDSIALGPHHVRVREAARLVLDARRGALDRVAVLPDPGLVVTALPHPWSVELAVEACRSGASGGQALLSTLTECSLDATRSELEWLGAHAERRLAREAIHLLAEMPTESGPALQIDVLGHLRLTIGGRVVERPELRRGRVRTLLALLAVRGPLRRDQLIDILWPDIDVDRARQNLRTTLTRLRQLIEPGRSEATHGTRLRSDGEMVSLARPPSVDVDLWQFRRLVARSGELARTSAPDALDALEEAVALWRGEPVHDLASVTGLDADIERIRSELVDAALRLGEQLLTIGRFDGTLECVERCESTSPYSERAHRLAIAAHLQLLDRDGLARRVLLLRSMLDDFGVEPEPATAMLLARADEMLDSTGVPGADHR